MEIANRIHELLREKAAGLKIVNLTIGLGYTMVILENGSCGIGYTWLDGKTSCSLLKDPTDYEGESSLGLLEKVTSPDLLERSLGWATVNALNYELCSTIPKDEGGLFTDLHITKEAVVGMIGDFVPVAKSIRQLEAVLHIFDIGKNIGTLESMDRILPICDSLIITSTSLIHGSTEELVAKIRPNTPCAMMGPTTPMLPEAFGHLPVTILAGMQVHDTEGTLKAIRHGRGTRDILKFSRKVYWSKPA